MQKPALIDILNQGIEDSFQRSDAAHEVGSEIPNDAQLTTGSCFDAYEVRPVVVSNETDCEAYFTLAEADEELARLEYIGTKALLIWTVYGHLPGEGVEALEDCDSEEQAHVYLFTVSGIRGVRGEWNYPAVP